jgi:hypothetical protein
MVVRQKQGDSRSVLLRGAILAGRITGTWRHRQHARAQDAFVLVWKKAWVQGCEAAWAGRSSSPPAEMGERQRAAWGAGWTWAQTQPDRRRVSRDNWKQGGRRSADAQRPLVRAAKGGAVGLIVFAAARWLMGARRSSTESSSSQVRPPD